MQEYPALCTGCEQYAYESGDSKPCPNCFPPCWACDGLGFQSGAHTFAVIPCPICQGFSEAIHNAAMQKARTALGLSAIPTNEAEDIAAAIQHEHPCEDSSCDIAEALSAGFVYSAAYLLSGATDTPLLNSVLALWHRDLGTFATVPDWIEWTAWCREHGTKCLSCGSFTYGEHEENCGNCLSPLASRRVEK